MNLSVTNNEQKNRFEAEREGETAFIEYKMQGDIFNLTHTEVPKEVEGKGFGTELVKETLDIIKQQGKSVKPTCPFIAHFIEENSEYKSLVG
jgi:predicted GNAT family acetyltransferase